MEEYTIYCTPEQTKKAFELGAPIKTRSYRFNDHSKDFFAEEGKGYFIPTAEQMIGWMEEKEGIREISLHHLKDSWHICVYLDNDDITHTELSYSSRKEATIAAIDAALKYLNNKN